MSQSNPPDDPSPEPSEPPGELEDAPVPAWALFLLVAFPFVLVILFLLLEDWLR